MVTKCPKCKKEYKLPDSVAGQRTRCAACGVIFRVEDRPAKAAPRKAPPKRPQPAAAPPQEPLTVHCPHQDCRQRFSVSKGMAGRKVHCPVCRRPFQIPAGPSEAQPQTPVHQKAKREASTDKGVLVRCPKPGCGQAFRAPRSYMGRKGRCPKCGLLFRLTPAAEKNAADRIPERASSGPTPPAPRPPQTPDFSEVTEARLHLAVRCNNCRSVNYVQEDLPAAASVEDHFHAEDAEEMEGDSPRRRSIWPGRRGLITAVMGVFLILLVVAALVLTLEIYKNNQRIAQLNDENEMLTAAIVEERQTRTRPPATAAKPAEPAVSDEAEKIRPYDFRKTIWGMSMPVVEAAEGKKPDLKEGDTIGYQGKLLGYDAYIFYVFVEDQLVRARYVLGEQYTQKDAYLTAFEDFRTALTEKYGPPSSEKMSWDKDRYKGDPDKWGLAVSTGDLKLTSTWGTGDTRIIMTVEGGNHNVDLMIEYSSRKLAYLLAKLDYEDAWEAL